jgi:hypothetical protein
MECVKLLTFAKRKHMQKLILNIEEGRYELLLRFLMTLDYVKVEQATPSQSTPKQPQSQLMLLESVLKQQAKPGFQEITDPVAWQKQQRDEWS